MSAHRKVVTVLFCDVVGSTALGESVDPEALQGLLARYFERMKGIVESHGGSVEKFVGDAVMAVFGVPRVHEDDALRACRAALEMRDALPSLGIEGRIGLMTGEVVTGTEERLATGDAVNVAARLEQAAASGEVLIGERTLELVRDAVDVEALDQLELKGKAEPVEAYRLSAVHERIVEHRLTAFVGREPELSVIHAALERVMSERTCELLTIVGEAGVGKSRLVAEALAHLDTRVLNGRCLPYGKGITYWPVVEVIKQLDALPADAAVASAIRSLLGESEHATSAEEIAWAFRKLLEERAPLVVVFDDIQWGEETFLDLLEHVALLSAHSPLLLIAMARPELAERRPAWPIALGLEPLPSEAVEELVGSRVSSDVRERIVRAAGGNPLFVSEVLAIASLEGGEVRVPPTLRGLLDTRLDQLDPADRRVIERAAVEGEVFHRGAVQALSPEETQVTPRLASLVRQGLIRPAKSEFAGEDGFRFQHLLFRDAAYRGLAKSSRAELHERVAAWLRGRDLVELDEILGYHLEQAWRYREELGLVDSTELADSARHYLAAAGRRAHSRQDYRAAASLLQRAAALVPPEEVDVPLELSLSIALVWQGDAREAIRNSGSVAERAAAADDRVGELCGRLLEGMHRQLLEVGEVGSGAQLVALAEEALPVFEAAGDDFALHIAYRVLGFVADTRARMDALVVAFERAATHAKRAGFTDPTCEEWSEYGRYHGTTPVSELLARQDELSERERRNAWLRGHRAGAFAMLGRFEEARTLLAELRAELADLGGGLLLALTYAREGTEIELLAGDPAAAVALGKEGCRLFEELDQPALLSTSAGLLAQAYYALDRPEEACGWADRAAELDAGDDAWTQMLWRQVRAKVHARRGKHSEAERLAREAIEISGDTEMPNSQASAFADLAEVLALAGRPEDAAEALEQALERYERKENLVMAERVRARLAELVVSNTAAERA
jgi:class 3 adenylate cyclase/tetratricopeptide (TPR) repeat protein